jgi:uncharacterized protein (TIGR00375 family)
MRLITDLHIHSRYSRACSKNINIENLEKYARLKGVDVLGTGDFQHPLWMKEIKEKLKEEDGVLKTEGGFPFLLQTEVSNMYSQGGKGRRVHSVILAPGMETAEQIAEELGKRGRLDYDGRPIFGFSCIELVDIMMGIDKHVEVIPAHAWTPWFSVFGSKSGFNSLRECFGERVKHIHAIETGLSSDPRMNWRLSSLDGMQFVSFSDAHSFWPHRIGREATVFDIDELTYVNVVNAIRTGQGLVETLEVDPAYGKYHWDGHRNCNVCLPPKETIKNRNLCPSCGNALTIGVEYRVEELADREDGFRPEGGKGFKSLIPLSEIIAAIKGGQPFSKSVWDWYYRLVNKFGSEFKVLLEAGKGEIEKVTDKRFAQGIIDVREGRIKVNPGYDGVYGEPVFREEAEVKEEAKETVKKQTSVFGFKKKIKKVIKKQKHGQRRLSDFNSSPSS